ncbi:MAG: hypothetical protein CVU88_04335 [Firmicutes bacterium HGW-Firmicutes-13]|nr:MAG: hypothetical protein CVU88_04335 [Firmicutes bacterium HGW-Firmicutes-13]
MNLRNHEMSLGIKIAAAACLFLFISLSIPGVIFYKTAAHSLFSAYKYHIILIFGLTIILSLLLVDYFARKIIKAEQELQQRKQEFRVLVENSPAIIARFDKEYRFVYINSAVERETGLPPEVFIGKTSRELDVPEKERVKWERAVQFVFDSGREKIIEAALKIPNGEKCYQARFTPEFAKDGSVQSVLCISHDITEHKKAEKFLQKAQNELEKRVEERTAALTRANETLRTQIIERRQVEDALRQSIEQYRQLVELSPDAIVVCYKDSIVFANKIAAELFGFSSARELVGKSYFELLHPDYREMARERNKLVLEQGKVLTFIEEKIMHIDGTVIDVEAALTPFVYEGKPAVQFVIRDVTERKKMDEEYFKASKLESIGILAGGIAHDFNNILAIIVGNISLARIYLNNKDDRVFQRLKDAEKACLQAKELTHQLQTFARGGAPVKKVFFIEELIQETTTLSLSGSNVQCQFSFPKNLFSVEVDEGQINQVINNLIINAVQAMPEGGKIYVKAENAAVDKFGAENNLPLKEGEYVKISFQDEGIGIPKKQHQKIFYPFFTTKKEGSGLGLATAYSIIKRHDGYITLESEEGVGTTFHIFLPASSKFKKIEKEAEKQLLTGKGKILVMDDEQEIRKVAGEMLSVLGYEAEFAGDGEEAVTQYKKAKKSGRSFDAVILDLTVPGGMGGKKALMEMLKIDLEAKAIVSSGYSDSPVISSYHEYGFKDFVAKPYKIEDLANVLHKVIACSSKTDCQAKKEKNYVK